MIKLNPNDKKSFVIGLIASLSAVVLWDLIKYRLEILNYEKNKKKIRLWQEKYIPQEEQAVIDKRTKEVADAKGKEKNKKKLMYIGGAVLVVGVAFYLLKKK